EIVFVDAASENGQRISNVDSLRRKHERITACFATRSLYKSALPQNAHQLGHVCYRETLVTADLRNGRAPVRAFMRDLQKTAQSVFLVRAQFHRCNFESGTVWVPRSKPSASFAASDCLLRSH